MTVTKGNVPAIGSMIVDRIGYVVPRSGISSIAIQKHPGARRSRRRPKIAVGNAIGGLVDIGPTLHIRLGFARAPRWPGGRVSPPGKNLVARAGTFFAKRKISQVRQHSPAVAQDKVCGPNKVLGAGTDE